jgi:quercetin dioxygenase-like cupin family protein
MEKIEFFKDYRDFVTFRPDRYDKATLFENEQVLVGLNCLEPGQSMEKHAHQEQCRFYVALKGGGNIVVGETQEEVQAGTVVWVPAGQLHRIINTRLERLVLLVGITPSKAD